MRPAYHAKCFVRRKKRDDMEKTGKQLFGVQLTLVGLFLVVFFEGVYLYPLVGLLFGVVGTAVVITTLLSETWP